MSMIFPDELYERRLPVYLLLDHSASMGGTKIVQLNQGVQLLFNELQSDPRSEATVNISVITFQSEAYQLELTPIRNFSPPELSAQGETALGAALRLLNESLDKDLKANKPGQKGDYKPLVFLLTDGKPTDSWQDEAQRLGSRTTFEPEFVVALAIGPDADVNMLKQVTDNILKIETVTGEVLVQYFKWVSNAIKAASVSAAQNKATKPISDQPLPQGVERRS